MLLLALLPRKFRYDGLLKAASCLLKRLESHEALSMIEKCASWCDPFATSQTSALTSICG